MRLDLVYENTAKDNAELLASFTYYLCSSNRKLVTDLEDLSISALANEIKRLFTKMKYSHLEVTAIEFEIMKEAEMINCFSRSFYVSGENFDAIGAGHNNGLIKNNIEQMAIAKMEKLEKMRSEQMARYAKRDSINKSLKEHDQLVLEVIQLIPNELYQDVVKDTCVNGMKVPQIANKYCIAYDSVGKYKERGISALSKIYKLYLSKYKKN